MELTHLADPEIAVMLTGRGYRLVAFENVLGTFAGRRALRRPLSAAVEVRLSAMTTSSTPGWTW